MHVEEYRLLEKNGVQLGVGTTKSGLGVLLYASIDDTSIAVVASEKNKVISTSCSEEILYSLDDGVGISEILSKVEGNVSFAVLNQTDKTSILARKLNGKIEVWK